MYIVDTGLSFRRCEVTRFATGCWHFCHRCFPVSSRFSNRNFKCVSDKLLAPRASCTQHMHAYVFHCAGSGTGIGDPQRSIITCDSFAHLQQQFLNTFWNITGQRIMLSYERRYTSFAGCAPRCFATSYRTVNLIPAHFDNACSTFGPRCDLVGLPRACPVLFPPASALPMQGQFI